MKLFLVTHPPLILIDLFYFYDILSGGCLISGFGLRIAVKNPTQFPFLNTKFVVFLHHCSLQSPPTVLGKKKKKITEGVKQDSLAAILDSCKNISTFLTIHWYQCSI